MSLQIAIFLPFSSYQHLNLPCSQYQIQWNLLFFQQSTKFLKHLMNFLYRLQHILHFLISFQNLLLIVKDLSFLLFIQSFNPFKCNCIVAFQILLFGLHPTHSTSYLPFQSKSTRPFASLNVILDDYINESYYQNMSIASFWYFSIFRIKLILQFLKIVESPLKEEMVCTDLVKVFLIDLFKFSISNSSVL